MNIIVICLTVCVCVFIISYFTYKDNSAKYKFGYHDYQCKHEYEPEEEIHDME